MIEFADQHQDESSKKLIKINEVMELTTLSKATIYRLQAAEKFPRSFKIAEKTSVWRLSTIENWIAKQEGGAK